MRAANDQARKALAEMKNRMSRRLNMMDMMDQKMNRRSIVASLSCHRGRDRIFHFPDEPTRKNGLWEFLFVASCRSSGRGGGFRMWSMASARSARLKHKRWENSSKSRCSCSFERLRV
jgi:hypothetical protein